MYPASIDPTISVGGLLQFFIFARKKVYQTTHVKLQKQSFKKLSSLVGIQNWNLILILGSLIFDKIKYFQLEFSKSCQKIVQSDKMPLFLMVSDGL